SWPRSGRCGHDGGPSSPPPSPPASWRWPSPPFAERALPSPPSSLAAAGAAGGPAGGGPPAGGPGAPAPPRPPAGVAPPGARGGAEGRLTTPSLPPAIMVWPKGEDAESRARLVRRRQGAYAAAVVGKGAAAELRLDGQPPLALTRQRTRVRFDGGPEPRRI